MLPAAAHITLRLLALRTWVLATEAFQLELLEQAAAVCRAYKHTVTIPCFNKARGSCEVLALARYSLSHVCSEGPGNVYYTALALA